jgi:hypothetical protein
MNTNQILIGAAVVGAAFLIYKRNQNGAEKPAMDTPKSSTDSKVDSTKSTLELNPKKGIAKPKRRPKPNERVGNNVIATSTPQSTTTAQNQIGVENAQFAFNGLTF